ncbi:MULTISPECIES: hypothetical protein [unclassified Moorena]|uniref:hypothetical protein n=1 Tax=unclassified Moorena TaxID=2683338 RepID=UPI0014000BE9|nr:MULTISPECIES: hypothetical protein [unclassified Moorena]NEO11065.1 hypothetical protein [Moorena sp. SIO3E8]NEQ00853.1 hypothetical protein [Moorena sp. SIO3F7]
MLVCQLFTARKNRIFVLFRRGGASRVVNKACRVSVRAASAKADTVGWSWQEAYTELEESV